MSGLILPLPEFVTAALNNPKNGRQHNLKFLLQTLEYNHSQECLLWPFTKHNRYGAIIVFKKQYYVHRLTYMLTQNQNLPDSLLVMHTCDNRPCFNPLHLLAGSDDDNKRDAIVKGRMAQLLKAEDIPVIRQLRAEGNSNPSIARMFGVTKATIKDVAHQRTWRWL